MIDLEVKIDMPKLDLILPDEKFWKAAAIGTATDIRKRTETQGLDVKGKEFKPYSKDYREYRKQRGRSDKPNLSFSARMLGSMRASSTKKQARLAFLDLRVIRLGRMKRWEGSFLLYQRNRLIKLLAESLHG